MHKRFLLWIIVFIFVETFSDLRNTVTVSGSPSSGAMHVYTRREAALSTSAVSFASAVLSQQSSSSVIAKQAKCESRAAPPPSDKNAVPAAVLFCSASANEKL